MAANNSGTNGPFLEPFALVALLEMKLILPNERGRRFHDRPWAELESPGLNETDGCGG